jgi:DNA excision repair protein ERCC-2
MKSQTVHVAISEFALPSPRVGHIEMYSGYGPLPDVGIEIHQAIQLKKAAEDTGYQAEKAISRTFERGKYKFLVSGRMDGFYDRKPARIEEIKSTFHGEDLRKRLEENVDHPYGLQLKTYGYFHWLQTGEIPELALLVVSSRTRQVEEIAVDLDLATYAAWIDRRLEELVEEMKIFEKIDQRRKKTAKDFQFPFEQPRIGQLDLCKAVEDSFAAKAPLLVQAPTGLGKTAGVLAPSLKEALSRGQKVLYLTPKNSQHAVAEETMLKIQESGNKATAMTLTAKKKMCFKNEPVCNPQACEFARDYYAKVAKHGLIEKLRKKKNLTARGFRKAGRDFEVCPFELQLEVASRRDVVICDYNYVFSPRNSVGRLSYNGLRGKGSPNLIIDEAHNLAPRAMDYFSPAISVQELFDLRESFKTLPMGLQTQGMAVIDRCIRTIHDCKPPGAAKPAKVKPETAPFEAMKEELAQFLTRYLESSAELQMKDPVLRLSGLWSDFTTALVLKSDGAFVTYRPDSRGDVLKIVCCDVASCLAEGYKPFANVVGFSATLKPFEYYSQISGFNPQKVRTAEFGSPFSKENRKLLVIPQVSTKWSDRDRESVKIKTAIERIVALNPGNYFVFFPSFDFMRKVADLVDVPGFEILRQEREMKADRIEGVLNRLREAKHPTLVFGVQGGVFSEGVDYPGDMLIGAIIVGPALPNFDFDRELMREYFETRYGHGFDYAYTYPAMAKVVQSAGRVIRSPQDKGVIVLMDQRFVQESYVKSMPADWFETSVQSLVSERVLGEISDFWEEGKPHEPS